MDLKSGKIEPTEGSLESRETITPESVYLNRRELLSAAGFLGMNALLLSAGQSARAAGASSPVPTQSGSKVTTKYEVKDPDRPLTKEELATGYNNFYEFSLEKKEVRAAAERWKPKSPWTIQIKGLVEKPMTLDLSAFLTKVKIEERVYRFRCVEAWSMVLPWRGFQLSELLQEIKPLSKAKYIQFTTHVDKTAMPNIAGQPHYPWPYTEGLRLDEAMHPLAFMATGLYGKPLPNQNGAPIRLVVPWKYGFKSVKSIDTIELTEQQPKTLWNTLNPDEYGFFANVNPDVSHPRWSQAKETRIDGSFFPTKIPTLRFNGYENEVAALYKGMDLKKNY